MLISSRKPSDERAIGGGENVSLFRDASYLIPACEVSDLQESSFGWGARYDF